MMNEFKRFQNIIKGSEAFTSATKHCERFVNICKNYETFANHNCVTKGTVHCIRGSIPWHKHCIPLQRKICQASHPGSQHQRTFFFCGNSPWNREHSCFLVRVLLSARTSRIFKFINKKMPLRYCNTYRRCNNRRLRSAASETTVDKYCQYFKAFPNITEELSSTWIIFSSVLK